METNKVYSIDKPKELEITSSDVYIRSNIEQCNIDDTDLWCYDEKVVSPIEFINEKLLELDTTNQLNNSLKLQIDTLTEKMEFQDSIIQELSLVVYSSMEES